MEKAQLSPEEFKEFLREEANLDDQSIEMLMDAGFDDFESLALAERETMQLLGFKDADSVYKNIKTAMGSEIAMSARNSNLMAAGVLD